jgi:hypothetical protein
MNAFSNPITEVAPGGWPSSIISNKRGDWDWASSLGITMFIIPSLVVRVKDVPRWSESPCDRDPRFVLASIKGRLHDGCVISGVLDGGTGFTPSTAAKLYSMI